MIIGVPLFAVMYYLFSKYVFKKLQQNDLQQEVDAYREEYPDKRIERDEKEAQKLKEKAARLVKVEEYIKKLKNKKK